MVYENKIILGNEKEAYKDGLQEWLMAWVEILEMIYIKGPLKNIQEVIMVEDVE